MSSSSRGGTKRKRAPPALFIREQQQQQQQQQREPQQQVAATVTAVLPAAKKPKISCKDSHHRPVVDTIELHALPSLPLEEEGASSSIFFPPTIDTNVVYKHGIRLRPTEIEVVPQRPGAKITYNRNNYYNTASLKSKNSNVQHVQHVQPILTPQQAQLWHHPYASTASNNLQFPVSKHRLLGTITRTVSTTSNMDKPKACPRPRVAHFPKRTARKTVAPATARKGLLACRQGMTDAETKVRVAEIQAAWETALHQSPNLQGLSAPWDAFGNLRTDVANEDGESYVPATDLYKWLEKVRDSNSSSSDDDDDDDDEEEEKASHLEKLLDILEACKDLSDPAHLWNIPLLLVYPIVTKHSSTRIRSNNKKSRDKTTTATTTSTYTIQMGVYGHRLLPMVTTKTLGIVMEALDPDSYRVTAPLCKIPQPAEATFCSSQYPIVTFDDDQDEGDEKDVELVEKEKENKKKAENHENDNDDDEDNDDDDDLDDLPDDERKMPAKPDAKSKSYDDWIDESNNKDTDRDDTRVSAFSTRGLLKLLENTGVDMSGYAERIEPHLRQNLQMQLLPHQQHAIQWMVQMEHLPGAAFGINSLLWEEREFLDGGKYYYCPSLGQLRLEAPADCKGGLLCDGTWNLML